MRVIKITVTDDKGTLLDSQELTIGPDVWSLAVRPMGEFGLRKDETCEIIIGKTS